MKGKGDPRTRGSHKVPSKGVIGAGGGVGEKDMLPNKSVVRDHSPQRKAPTWKTGKSG